MNKTLIGKFIRSINQNAPLSSTGKYGDFDISNYKYPYKPILIISIIINIKNIDLLFNSKIIIDENSPITKTYYDLLTNSEAIFNFLKLHNSKEEWFEIYNQQVKRQVVSNIFNNPAKKLKAEGFWYVNKKQKYIEMRVNGTHDELEKLKTILLDESLKCLRKCVPDYKDLNLNEICTYDEYLMQRLRDGFGLNENKEKQGRKYQHIFSKKIFNRDRKCMICCLDLPELLEAAHIKPYSTCHNDLERYDENNGILLCCNHHKLYDRGLFTFEIDGTIKISKTLNDPDNYLLIKTFEPCYRKNSYYYAKEYINFHQKNIFRG